MTIVEKIQYSEDKTVFTLFKEGLFYKRYVLLPVAGNRNNSNGSLNNVGSNGNYWSSTVDGTNSRNLNFNSSNANMNNNNRANGNSVRCRKDCNTLHGSTTALVSFNYNNKQLI
jgi:hypothetical protein